jgi:predicted dinucleotide-binding enzyme
MKIGIIGSGNIGATLARLFAHAGHEVAISNSRGPESLSDLVAEIGANAHAVTVDEAAAFGDVVVEAIPFGRYEVLPADCLAGKIVVTAGNYYPDRDGEIDFEGLMQSAVIARHLPGARVVKAFNTIWYQHLAADRGLAHRRVPARSGAGASRDAEAPQGRGMTRGRWTEIRRHDR